MRGSKQRSSACQDLLLTLSLRWELSHQRSPHALKAETFI